MDMSRTLQQLGIDRLSPVERIELIGQIWDSITGTDEDFPLPEWHRRELERRRAAAEADPATGIPWEVVKARLTERS
jgi:putative addiction module component (TIGR02574 family)